MDVVRTALPEVVIFRPKFIVDARGYFAETFRESTFQQIAGQFSFVQENQSLSERVGTVRGLHFQLPPKAQGKLVKCLSGSVFDVAVDIRAGSPTYGLHVAVELSAENGLQLWIPPGFAHGFCTTAPHTVISYKVTDYYSAEHDRGLLWNDPALGIHWPVDAGKGILSEKDEKQPRLAELPEYFSTGQG